MSNETRPPQANIPPFGLRMQPSLKARIDDAAKKNNRSINAEIVARLEASFGAEMLMHHDEIIKEHEEKISRLVVLVDSLCGIERRDPEREELDRERQNAVMQRIKDARNKSNS